MLDMNYIDYASYICPSPLYDIFLLHPKSIYQGVKVYKNIIATDQTLQEELYDSVKRQTQILIFNLLGTALAALEVFAVYQTTAYIPPITWGLAGLSSVVILPISTLIAGVASIVILPLSTLIAGGGYLLYHGVAATVAAVSAGALAEIAKGILLLSTGWLVLKYHNHSRVFTYVKLLRPLTILELVKWQLSDYLSDQITKYFISK